jgi:ribonuclease D
MGDRTLLALAEALPSSESELRGLPGMSAGQVRRVGRGVLKAIEYGSQQPAPRRPPSPRRPSDDILARYEALRTWRKERARKRGVESDVIVSRDALWALARQAPASAEELDTIAEIGPWKTAAYGTEILDVIATLDNEHHGNGHRRQG